MSLLSLVGKLEGLYYLATTAAPDAIDRAADVAEKLSEVGRGFADYLRTLKMRSAATPDFSATDEMEIDSRLASLQQKAEVEFSVQSHMRSAAPSYAPVEGWTDLIPVVLKIVELIRNFRKDR